MGLRVSGLCAPGPCAGASIAGSAFGAAAGVGLGYAFDSRAAGPKQRCFAARARTSAWCTCGSGSSGPGHFQGAGGASAAG